MTVRISMNAAFFTIALVLGLVSPVLAEAACIDDPCPSENRSQYARPMGSLEWQFKSNYKYKVRLKFFSQSRDGHEWPSTSRHYLIDDYDTHTYNLRCRAGETICYGAWTTSEDTTYWGAGKDGKAGCDDCCYRCGDNTRRKVLNN